MYAIPSFWGFLTCHLKDKLQSVLNRATKLNFYSSSGQKVNDTVTKLENDLFTKIVKNPNHILHYQLPPTKTYTHDLRRKQTFSLPIRDDRQFVNRNIYKNINFSTIWMLMLMLLLWNKTIF